MKTKVEVRGNLKISEILIYLFITLFSIACLLPFILIISASLTDESAIVSYGYRLWPQSFSTNAYKLIFGGAVNILKSYEVTILVTVIGTLLSVFLTLITAYPLSRKKYKYRNAINFYFFFTMLFSGGIVPWFILCTRYLGLRNNYLALIIPYLLSAWYIFLLRNFLMTLPDSIEESAKIDGAGDYTVLFKIFVPISLPGVATVALFVSLMYWNDWWLGLMLCDDNKIVPLQLYLMQIIQNIEFLKNNIDVMRIHKNNIPSESVRMALCVVAIGPIVFAYPFFQRYFIKGLTIGAIKG